MKKEVYVLVIESAFLGDTSNDCEVYERLCDAENRLVELFNNNKEDFEGEGYVVDFTGRHFEMFEDGYYDQNHYTAEIFYKEVR